MDVNLTISVVLSADPSVTGLFSQLISAIDRNTAAVKSEEVTMAQIDDDIVALTAKVQAESDVVTSAVTLLNGVPAMIADAVATALAAGATPAQLQALTDLATAVDAQTTTLANAVAANTPAAPAPTP